MNTQIIFSDTKNTIKEINKERLSNKDNWIFIQVSKGKDIFLIKSFNTYLQVIRKNGINFEGGIDLKVSDWKKRIENCLVSE